MDEFMKDSGECDVTPVVVPGAVHLPGEVGGNIVGVDCGPGDNESCAPDWRCQIEAQCQLWLDSLEGKSPLEPESEQEPEQVPEIPDIYSFYAELCAVRHEFRKQSRRTTDGLSRFGGIMDKFEVVFNGVVARLERANEGERQTKNLEDKRAMFLPLVDLYDRFQRLEDRLAAPPPMGFFGSARRRQAWDSVHKGFSILRDHFAALLRESGVEKLVTVGQHFDPRSMKVVEVEETAAGPAEVVLEELRAAYLYQGQVLRLAEVKVAKGRKKDQAQSEENR